MVDIGEGFFGGVAARLQWPLVYGLRYSMLGQMRQPTPRTNQSEGGNSLG